MTRECPRQCISTHGQPASATTAAMPGSARPPETSLTIMAPAASAAAATAAGVDPARLILDPGIGFAKNADHNWTLSAHLDRLVAVGHPVLFGASRKSYLGRLLAGPDGTPRPVREREAATIATSVLAAAAGAWGVRVHDVRGTVDALAVWRATGCPRFSPSRP